MARQPRDQGPLVPPADAGSEEESLLAAFPESRRIGRVIQGLETIAYQEGFLHLTTEDIARHLRCSKTTLYRIAGTREELFDLVIELWLARIRDTAWRRAEAADDWSDRLSRYLSAPVDHMDAEQTSFAFFRDVNSYPSGQRILMAHQKKRVDGVEHIIRMGIAAGAYADVHPKLVAETLIRMVRELVDPTFVNSVGLSTRDCVDELCYIVEYGLRPRSAGEGGREQRPLRTAGNGSPRRSPAPASRPARSKG